MFNKKLIIFFCMIFLIANISAFDFDNVKYYDSSTKEITIKNAFGIPLIGSDLAVYKLESNTDQCLINCEAEGTAVLYTDGYLFTGMNFKDASGKVISVKNYDIYYEVTEETSYQNPIYDTTCKGFELDCIVDKVTYETVYENKTYWKLYSGEVLSKGTYKWKLKGKKGINDSVDWIGTSFGEDFNEWAWWDSSWTSRKEVNITGGSSSLSNFTVLLNISYEANMQADFEDLRFVNGSCTNDPQIDELDYEFDYVINSNSALVWVRMDELATGVNSICMYYGDSGASSGDSGRNAWDENYVGVFHFTEGAGAKTKDSITQFSFNINGTPTWKDSSFGLGKSLNFTGTQFVELNQTDTTIDVTGRPITVEYWIVGNTTLGTTRVVSGDTNGWDTGTISGNIRWGHTGVEGEVASALNTNINTSIQITHIINDVNFTINNTAYSGNPSELLTGYTSVNYRIGEFLDGTNGFAGEIDEIKVSTSGRSDAWLDRSFQNVDPSLVVFGTEEILSTGVSVNLISPEDELQTSNITIVFDSSATCSDCNLTNATVKIWFSNGTLFKTNSTIDISGISNSTNLTINNLLIESGQIWNVEWCGNDGDNVYNCSFDSTNRTFDTQLFTINDDTWVNNTLEGSIEVFELNVTLTSGKQLSYANLVYNGTNYAGNSINPSGTFYSIKRTLIIPSVNENVNNTFYWNIISTDGSETNSTSHNQSVLNIEFGNCSVYDSLIYNFSIYDEETQTSLNNGSIEVQFNLYDSSKTNSLLNFSQIYTNVNVNQATICTNLSFSSTTNYSVDVVIKYKSNETTVNYATEYYNLLSDILSNTTVPRNIKLYDLKQVDSTEFQLTFRDSNYLLAPNILVYLYRQYVSDNDFKVVEIPLTDSNGQTVLHLVRNDVVYNLVMVDENRNIVATFNKIIAFCQDYTIGQCTINLNAPSTGDNIYNYSSNLGISYSSPTYSDTTKLISFNFLSLNLSSILVRMDIIKNGNFGNRSVCSDSLTASSGILTCDVSSVSSTDKYLFINIYTNGEYVATETIDLYADSFTFGIANGAFFAFLMILFLVTMFMEDKQVLIISLGIGWASIVAMGLVKGSLFGVASAGIWLIVSIIIFLWKLKKEDEP